MRKSDYPKVLRRGIAGLVILLLLFGAFAPAAMAQAWPRCVGGCTANDVDVNRIWLDVPGSCMPNEAVTADVWMNLYFHRQNTYCIVVVADLYEDGELVQSNWTSNIISYHRGGGNYDYNMGTVSWTCGKNFEMRNILVMWRVNDPKPDVCSGTCADYRQKSQCNQPGNIIVGTPLVAGFEFTTVCYCTDTQFTNKTTGGVPPYTFDWDFNDSSPHSSEQNPSHHYAAAGTYNVTLTVTDSNTTANTDSQSYDVTVYAGPTADFSADQTSCCTPLTVQFTDLSTAGDNPITGWSWDFDNDGTPDSTVQNPSHQYSTSGTYTVNLTVTDSHGCTDYEVKTDYISANAGPTADFSADQTSCCTPLTVQFTDLSTAGDNPITGWSWDFDNDGTPDSTVQNPSHQYSTSGTYTVNLTVTDSHGCTDYEVKIDYITANENPTATASSNSPVCVGDTIELYGGPEGMSSYSWTGPGTWTSDEQNPTRLDASLAMAGEYTLTVTDANGCTDNDYVTVTVVESCVANAPDFRICQFTTVNDQLFLDHGASCSGGCTVSLSYSFDGTTPGKYTYIVTCEGDCGGDTDTGTVTVVLSW